MEYRGRKAGTLADIGCFSFYPSKNLGAFGDAGAVAVHEESLAAKFRIFRNYGSEKRYHNQVVGANSRLDELQAGLLRVRLSHLDDLTAERRRIAEKYSRELSNPLVSLPVPAPGAESVWHQYVIRCEARERLIPFLEENGIGTLIHYPIPPHLAECYRALGHREGSLPVTEHLARTVLSLPIYNGMTEEEQGRVIEAVNRFR